MIKLKKFFAVLAAALSACMFLLPLTACGGSNETVVLRVCSWEEYIDLGKWDEEDRIEIDNPYAADGEEGVFGVNSVEDDFTKWFNEEHDFGFKVRVEYSTFGTNEDLYNRLSLGDVYDLVCPSDYMLMKLIAEDNYVTYSDEFWNLDNKENYYANFVSRYIDGDNDSVFNEYDWHKKAACYMWGTTGLVYNPEKLSSEEVSSWGLLLNEKYKRQVTIKDNVRDAYFATLGIINKDTLTGGAIDDATKSSLLNATDELTISKAQDVLKAIKENVYSFETDSGKSDMVTGKVLANYQWSGDAVYILDEAESDKTNPTELWYSVPDECANLWFDGWLMLKTGIDGNEQRKTAAEAFVNFLSRPDNAIRNMNYIGYSSAITDQTVFDYMEWNYGADEDAEEVFDYDLSYLFGEGYSLSVDAANFEFSDETKTEINRGRQLFAQYPPQNVIDRSVIMLDFGEKLGEINQMWINVRCPDLLDFSPVTVGIVAGIIIILAAAICLYSFRYRLFIKNKPKNGFERA
ncbi:MAG: extracellular solute-binding protein [Clostridia bacterium]|nr:extracellular solute-binding protein [Clostridia bacterium]